VLAQLLLQRGFGSRVLAVEHIPELLEASIANVTMHNSGLVTSGVLQLCCLDATSLTETFDVVHCGAALTAVDPWLLRLVRPGGRIVVPLGPVDAPQRLCAVDTQLDGSFEVSEHIAVLYVPIVRESEQRSRWRHWDEVVERCMANAAVQTSIAGDEAGR